MRVMTPQAIEFDLSLTGKETQETFNREKYLELAYGSPRGARLAQLVEANWPQWVETVNKAPWLKNWSRSMLRENAFEPVDAPDRHGRGVASASWLKRGMTPLGNPLPSGCSGQTRIAYALYAEAIWGYGVKDWIKYAESLGTDSRVKSKGALRCILQMQNVSLSAASRCYLFDDAIYRGTGLMIPCEFGDLDRWLEGLWFQAVQDRPAAPDCDWVDG